MVTQGVVNKRVVCPSLCSAEMLKDGGRKAQSKLSPCLFLLVSFANDRGSGERRGIPVSKKQYVESPLETMGKDGSRRRGPSKSSAGAKLNLRRFV